MATVPGVPDNTIPKTFAPTQADMLMAAAIMHQQGKFQMAGDTAPPLDPNDPDVMKNRLKQLLYDRSLYGKRGESLPDPYPPNLEINRLRGKLKGS